MLKHTHILPFLCDQHAGTKYIHIIAQPLQPSISTLQINTKLGLMEPAVETLGLPDSTELRTNQPVADNQ